MSLRSAATDTFDQPHFWLTAPGLAYASWIASHPLQARTKNIYIQMWGKFTRWLSAQGIALGACEAHHVAHFIEFHRLQKAQGYRYVRLVERAFVHLQLIGMASSNPGTQAALQRVARGRNADTMFLSLGERERLFAALRGIFREAAEAGSSEWGKEQDKQPGMNGPSTVDWARLRDAAMAAVMVGGGVKVAELWHLPVSCTLWEHVLKIPAKGNIREHMAVLFPIAEEGIEAWVSCRDKLGLATEILFPAALDRRRHDQRVKTEAMHPSTVWRRVAALLEESGLVGARMSGQTLRNTYAAMLIENGADDEKLIECLGLFAPRWCERLRDGYEKWNRLQSGGDSGEPSLKGV